MSDKLTQGQRIRMLRIKKRFTLEYVAKHLKTTKQAIHKYEADIVKKIPNEKLFLLSNLLNCSVEYIVGDSNDASPPQINAEQTKKLLSITLQNSDLKSKTDNIDSLQFYHELMCTVTKLSITDRNTVLKFAKFLEQE